MITQAARPFTISLENPLSSECGDSRERYKTKPEAFPRLSTRQQI
jgi:hypothetical protein